MAQDSTHGSILTITDNLVQNSPTKEAQTVADKDHQDLINQQQADDCLQPIIEYVKSTIPSGMETRHKTSHQDPFTMIDGILYYVEPQSYHLRLAVPKVLQQQLMEETHAGTFSGHFLLLGEYIVS